MVGHPPASWRAVLYSYPCPTCGALPGMGCVTYSGRKADMPHAARADAAHRCAKCATRLARLDEGPYCPHCQLVRDLEAERYHRHERQDP